MHADVNAVSVKREADDVIECSHDDLSTTGEYETLSLVYGPADAIATHCLSSVKSRLVLPFWFLSSFANLFHHILPFLLPD